MPNDVRILVTEPSPEPRGTEEQPQSLGAVDPTAPGYLPDPYPHFAQAREHAPVQQHSSGVYMIFRYPDVKRALSDRSLSSSEATALQAPRNLRIKAAGGDDAYLLRPSLSKLDGPEHAPLRKLLARPFTPANVKRYAARAEQIVAEQLSGHGPGDELDVIGQLAHPLPFRLVCEMFGIPEPADAGLMYSWTWAALNLLDPFSSRQQIADYIAAQRQFSAHLRDVIAWKREHLSDDLLSGFIRAGDEGTVIGPDEVAATIHTLFVAGFDTTVNQLGLSVLALLRHRREWERLVADRSLLDNAIEELLRFESTAQLMIRIAPEDYPVAGSVIPAGNHVVAWIASANRDEGHFGPTADELDITRPTAREHIAFGYGPHACLGAWLARLELRTVLNALLDLAPNATLIESPLRWSSTPFIRGLAELRLALA
ncbi:cytochrome P450 [Nocardia farcinica]|uniref:cytochrome P450 n=1 Tax=Nocardia farcinica TaxID=37329 RepID=UPI002454EEA4|nr:cytochrome P450 [Nocardia farcinica]